MRLRLQYLIILLLLLTGTEAQAASRHHLTVTATAFTTAADETKPTHIGLTAWGDHLKPGMKAIAVSRDLLHRYGLSHGSAVTIKGLPGTYIVRDKMNRRWRKRIDIYMTSKKQALEWGKRQVTISW